ncbi:Alpha/beta hydrolase fold-1 [Sporodiniella umbellata]|nr:Alpha/beta hydrolase fold-1 [Sporodiniella umbellata]
MNYFTYKIPASPFTEGHDTDFIAVEQHEFLGAPSCATISFVVSHATGFHKEAYRPLFSRIEKCFRSLEEFKYISISFYAIDARCHGDSSLLNNHRFHSRIRWVELALDIKNVIDVLKLKDKGKVFSIGHSVGGSCSILCEDLYPKTFDGMLLLEPGVMSDFVPLIQRIKDSVYSSERRREEWENREQFEKHILKNAFWKSFHPEVLKNYMRYSVYETEKGTIKLKCPKDQEHGMPILNASKRIRIPVHYVFGMQSFLPRRDPRIDSIIGSNPRNTFEIIEGSHMVPLERPDAIERVTEIELISKI